MGHVPQQTRYGVLQPEVVQYFVKKALKRPERVALFGNENFESSMGEEGGQP